MRSFVRGEKSKFADMTPATLATVSVRLEGPDTYDVSCFGVDAAGKLSDDRYFIFFNQPSSPEGAITTAGPGTFNVDLSRVPASIQKLVFTATIDGNGTMSGLRSGSLKVAANGADVAGFAFTGSDFAAEKALMIAELYMKDVWRFAAVGQGFNGGLSALLAHFGGQEAASAPAAAAPPPPPSAPQPAPAPAPAAPTVNLGKVTLAKSGDKRTVSLAKGGSDQSIQVNLNWNQGGGNQRRGFLSGGSSAPDLDLGCFWELKDGSKGVIQPLGKSFGSRTAPPFVFLDKDDQSGASSDGENLHVIRPAEIKRVMVFAMIYKGANDFTSVGARLGLRDQSGSETEIYLNNPDSNRTFCSVCLIEERGGEVTITKEERYFRGASDADKHYGFGFRWSAGRK